MALVLPPLMTALLWGFAGLLVGGVLAHLVPALVAGSAPIWLRQRIGDFYGKGVAWAIGRGAIIDRSERGIEMHGRGHDSDLDGDRVLGGLFRDQLQATSRLQGKLWTFGTDRFPVYLRPLHAWLGRNAGEQRRDGGFGPIADGGRVVGYSPFLPVPDKEAATVRLREAEPLLRGDADPSSADESQEFTEISQEKFHEKISIMDVVLVMGAFVVGAGVRWFLNYLGNSGGVGGSTVTLPGTILPVVEVLPL